MSNSHGIPDTLYEAHATWRDAFLGYVVSGGVPDTSLTLTLPPFATNGYVAAAAELVYVQQPVPASGFDLTQGAGTYYVGLGRDTTATLTGWTRWPGTHYVTYFGTPTDPLLPGVLPLARLTVSATAITAVAPTPMEYALRLPRSLAITAGGSMSPAVGSGVDATTQLYLRTPGGMAHVFGDRVGLGTETPTSLLEVAGLATLRGALVPDRAGDAVIAYQSFINLGPGSNRWGIYHGGTAPSYLGGQLTVDSQTTINSALRVGGGASGVRYQNVGADQGDGYSNHIAFGWNGTLQGRVDGTLIGTITVTPSDARVKQAVQADVPGLAAVLALRPISFAYDQTARPIGFAPGRHYGLIAQEAQAQVPLAVTDDATAAHFLSVDYGSLVPVLIQAVQDLAAQVQTLQARLATLAAAAD